MANKDLFTRRGGMAFVGIGLWIFMALWTLSAFWQHIDELKATYQFAAKCGAMAGEFAALAFVIWHCFNKHIGVRKWALVFALILPSILVAHAGALRGMQESTIAQRGTEDRTREALTKMTQDQSGAIKGDTTGTQRERLAKNRAALREQAEIAKNAQKEVAATIAASDDKIKDTSIFPRWYLDGWMYSLIFIAALVMVSCIFALMMADDVDADFDGVVDKHQRREFQPGFAGATAARKRDTDF